ncbi:DOPA 4,5-dioxygenase [Vibrio ishigakensis]|uniref:DOPA 4,5-dioxygenase n=1 Tax=Vibrio ishigakensis TaxID=1481914 RepID=A0A0B8NTL7_9VIBR|nr:DOPA 4,5-dioxygenase family protein [Vibrio ishigakensis]GAM54084.1 DOPA 4,5-dioxygenase [Vibrio ishigakensis]
MENPKRPINAHVNYHAHVYFDAISLDFATKLCHQAGDKFGLQIGRVHQRNVGPHTKWSCQLIFTKDDFDAVIPWLDSERDGLSVLVHGVTGDDLKDHTEHAYWLGDAIELDLSRF